MDWVLYNAIDVEFFITNHVLQFDGMSILLLGGGKVDRDPGDDHSN